MMLTINADVIWIKPEYGGRSKAPVVGLRPTIRFQRYIADWMEIAWDVEIIDLDIDENTWTGSVILKFIRNVKPKTEWLKEGELIELLDAYRVIAVGKISNTSDE